MALKIFVSSVFEGLKAERKAIETTINGLQDLFVGMEYFGSLPASASDHDEKKVAESDIYLGIFGSDYGSIEEKSGKSFTELEYRAAIENNIPCLIYFKDTISGDPENDSDQRLVALKKELATNHIIQSFESIEDLKIKFLVDFIKIVRETFWQKASINQGSNPIKFDILHSLSKSLIEEQIRSVGADKYLSSLYIPRKAVESEIMNFVDFETVYLERLRDAFGMLSAAGKKFRLIAEDDTELAEIQKALTSADSMKHCLESVDKLKQIFFFDEVEKALSLVNSIVLAKDDRQFNINARKLANDLKGKPFVDSSSLYELPRLLLDVKASVVAYGFLNKSGNDFLYLIRIFPSMRAVKERAAFLVNDVIRDLEQMVSLTFKRCLVLVDKAGTGKTNVICNVSEKLIERTPVFLIGGYASFSGEYGLDLYVQERLQAQLAGNFSDWLNRTDAGLKKAGKWLFIFIDGINENSDLAALSKLFASFLPRIREKRIKLILSCRDVLWDVFSPVLIPHSFDKNGISLNNYSEPEWNEAINAYLEFFKIKASFSANAKNSLKNPLLMRFFCEVHRDQGEIGLVRDIRLLSVFDLYIEKIGWKIAHLRNSVTNEEVINFLITVVNKMWMDKKPVAHSSNLSLAGTDLEDKNSIYNLILSENIIFSEQIHGYSGLRTIRFVYDELMEYLLARCWIDTILAPDFEEEKIDHLIEEAVDSFHDFPTAFGALLFLDKMLNRKGRLINKTIIKIAKEDDSFSEQRQIATLNAFENIAVTDIEEEIITALETFESVARDDIKDRLAEVMLRVAKENIDHPKLRRFVKKILDVTDLPMVRPQPLSSAYPPKAEVRMKKNPWESPVRESYTERPAIVDEMNLLPPSRYHYSDKLKLTAISVLVGSGNKADYELASSGMTKLGQMELHNALEALALWDAAEDDKVFEVISANIGLQSEFRIYCAWLLRTRYGENPASLLLQLLTDRETRVHEYTFKIFAERYIEAELIVLILKTIRSKYLSPTADILKTWHLRYLIKLLSLPERFETEEVIWRYGFEIVAVLRELSKRSHNLIRLEAYKALIKHIRLINRDELLAEVSNSDDIYIQKLAKQIPGPGSS